MSCGQAHTVGRRERSTDGVSARTACRVRAKSRSRAGLDFHELGGPCIQRLPHTDPRADRLSLALIALALAAPNLIWQATHGLPMAFVTANIVSGGSTSSTPRAALLPSVLLGV